MSKESFPRCITPPGIVRYAWLEKPDEKSEKSPFGDNKYKCTLLFDRTVDLKPLKEAVLAAARMKWGAGVDLTKLQKPFVDGDSKAAKHPDYAGKVVITAKSQFKPVCVGTIRGEGGALNTFDTNEAIWAGDTARLSLEAYPYEQTKDVIVVGPDGKERNESRKVAGVMFQLRSVQLISKGERVGGNSAKDFDTSSDEYVIAGVSEPARGGVTREIIKAAAPAPAKADGDFDLF